jgi:hypothetical protein
MHFGRFFISLIVTFLTAVQAWSAMPLCSQAHNVEMTTAEMAKSLVDDIPWDDWNAKVTESRISGADQNGRIEVIRSSSFEIELMHGLHRSSAFYYSRKEAPKGSKSAPVAKLSRWAQKQFEVVRNRALDLVLEAYRKRRPHWPSNFREKLQKLAIEYEKESTYIISENMLWEKDGRDRTDPSTRKSLEQFSTIRLIHEKNGHIPMEDYLGIEILTGANQLKVEPGNFAMSHEGNEISSVEFAIHLIAQMQRYRTEFGKEPFFATYADTFSERLYGAMGFQYLRGDLISGVPEGADTGRKIQIKKDDVNWAPMYATEAMLRDHLESRVKKAAEKRESEKLLQQLQKALVETEKATTTPAEVYIGFGKNRISDQDQNPIARLYVRRGEKSARLYLQPHYEYKRKVFRSGLLITVPLPLTEGLRLVTESGMRIEYNQGLLKITEEFREENIRSFTSYVLSVDPMLLQPQWARVNQMTDSQVEKDSEYFF